LAGTDARSSPVRRMTALILDLDLSVLEEANRMTQEERSP
jgi:hypothetical protein